MYIPFQVNRFQKKILIIVQYKYSKSCSGEFFSKIQQKSDPPHKIMRSFLYYSTQLAFSFQPGRNLPGGNDLYQHRRGILEGPALKFFYMIHRGGRSVHIKMYIQLRIFSYTTECVGILSYITGCILRCIHTIQ